MIYIEKNSHDPHFNVAVEEHLLRQKGSDLVMIWKSEPSVVIGKHQNAISEINLDWIRQNKIPVIRRISGGGTVYHDLGNINYTVITTESRKDRMIDFQKFTQPIVDFLDSFGIEAVYNGKNNLFIGDRKISGCAAHVHKNRVMHHGTILFDSNLADLDKSIKANPGKSITDKAVQSVRSTVTNIREHLDVEMDILKFESKFKKYIINYHNISNLEELLKDDMKAVSDLADKKYKTWEWTFGYSPSYQIQSDVKVSGHQTTFMFTVEKGLLTSFSLEGNSSGIKNIRSILKKIIGLPHHPDPLDPYLRKITSQTSEIKQINDLLF